ncbi:MAG: hypothetical protein IT428_33190 [Planctomycetaceae bacterium]|nr:hypothetical protein [Planctomycetaceae bacterium]
MSALGPSGLPALSLAQSLANSQRADSPTARADAATAAAHAKQAQERQQHFLNVADVGSSSDRDPDGRALADDEEDGAAEESSTGESKRSLKGAVRRRPLPPDPRGRLGKTLDFEA